jgi:hypothetical protein
VVGPHPQNIDLLGIFVNAIDESMLAVDAASIRASQFADRLFIRRRVLPWVWTLQVEK